MLLRADGAEKSLPRSVVEYGITDILQLSTPPVAHGLLPCPGIDKGNLVGCYTDDIAVFLMELLHPLVALARHKQAGVGELRDSP